MTLKNALAGVGSIAMILAAAACGNGSNAIEPSPEAPTATASSTFTPTPITVSGTPAQTADLATIVNAVVQATRIAMPTAVPQPTPIPTPSPIPQAATPTPIPRPTYAQQPPAVFTATSPPPRQTPSPNPTSRPVPQPIPTQNPVPTATSTIIPSPIPTQINTQWNLLSTKPPAGFALESALGMLYNGNVYMIKPYQGANEYVVGNIRQDGSIRWSPKIQMPRCIAFSSSHYGIASALDPNTGTVYIAGGVSGFDESTAYVCSARIQPDGSLGQWRLEFQMIKGRFSHAIMALKGKLYAVGGTQSNNGFLKTAEYAKINPDGTLGQWTETAPMNMARPALGLAAIVSNDNTSLLAVGGGRHGTILDTIEEAMVKPDGSLSPWETLPSGLSAPRTSPGVAVHQGRLYVVGGNLKVYGGEPTNSTEVATINTKGQLGKFGHFQPLHAKTLSPTVFTLASRIYVVGKEAVEQIKLD